MFTNILVALDGSPQSLAVIELGRKISAGKPANLHILCVVDGAYLLPGVHHFLAENPTNNEASDGLVYPPANHEYHEARRIVSHAVTELTADNRHVSGLIVGGEPTEVIIREAARLKVDLIVMGHRHLSSLQRWVEHSIVKEVIDLAACPVLVENQETEPSC
ncbi:nucleotide-binding universal stress UspA family protein [Rahnella sp. BIGb0603]|jgi:nucleotide-binding universal stress UspA family protein|uniref:universal stress protein n=1 Tax=Rahnella sp. BIGb0603 TaxID=2940612 RepID=UPI002169685E|nr:universal stress protein [Rahnella sp. BIGb0603]MCS3424357.1 nucleotide-binding universal stress UspA family protein [Rahnella sp. BIGb0603]